MKTMTEEELIDWIGESTYVMEICFLRDLFAGMKLVPADAVVLTMADAELLLAGKTKGVMQLEDAIQQAQAKDEVKP